MQYIKESLKSYIENRIPTGGFLHAVLSNDLMKAFQKADMRNRYQLFEIVEYIYNNLPINSYGSPEQVDKWLKGEENE